MQVEIQLDAACTEPQVIIRTAQVDDAVQALAKRISDTPPQLLTGSRDGAIEILNPSELIRIFADGEKPLPSPKTARMICVCGCMKRKNDCRTARLCGFPNRKL